MLATAALEGAIADPDSPYTRATFPAIGTGVRGLTYSGGSEAQRGPSWPGEHFFGLQTCHVMGVSRKNSTAHMGS